MAKHFNSVCTSARRLHSSEQHKHIAFMAVISAMFFLSFPLLAQQQGNDCGPLENPYGPYDYRTDKDKLPIVLGAHFTTSVETLVRGVTSVRPGGDIDYTLRAIPNHPRALLAMMRLGEKEKTDKPFGARYTVECWFDRAIRFRPDDHVVRMLYVTFLTNSSRKSEASRQLEVIVEAAKDNPFTHYNAGLLYFELGEYDRAVAQAHKALDLGFTRSDLVEKLKGIGKWVETVSVPSQSPKPTIDIPADTRQP